MRTTDREGQARGVPAGNPVRDMQAARGTALTGRPEAAGSPAGRRRVGMLLAVAAGVYAADVVSKVVVVATLSHRPPVRLLGGLLNLMVLRNSGAAFSIGTSMTIVFTAIAVGVIFFILRTSRRLRSLPWAVTLGLLLGGASGNLTDRILRSPGVFPTPDIPIIMLTALDSRNDRLKGLEAGADAHISKPYSIREVILTAQRLIDRRRRERFLCDAINRMKARSI